MESNWGPPERQRFRVAWLKLRAHFRQKDDPVVCQSDGEVLGVYPIESIERACHRLALEGSSTNWFPTCPEIAQVAGEEHAKLLESHYSADRLLALPQEAIDEDMVIIRKARADFLRELRANGGRARAQFFRKTIPVRHASEDSEAPYCSKCSDEGRYGEEGIAYTCNCVDENPVILARQLRGQHKTIMVKRKSRAASLKPASNPTPLLS